MNPEIREQLRQTYLTGGTGIITTTDGKIVTFLAATMRLKRNCIEAITERSDLVRIPEEMICHANPA